MRSVASVTPARSCSVATARLRLRADLIGVLTVVILTVAVTSPHLLLGTTIGQDAATQFYPWYAFLGDRLRSGEIPAWNPHQFSGAPFAADPQSGWMYLPAMLLFALLPLNLAVKAFVFGHLLLAGVGAYTLGRVLGFSIPGALVAATAFQLSGVVIGRSVCCPATIQVASWIPTMLLTAELAIRARSRLHRVAGWSATGFVVSQILAGWLGQGAYYALLALGGYIAYRTIIDPPMAAPGLPSRLTALATHGTAVLALGFSLAAAGILPRLEYNAVSNLAGGSYAGDHDWAAEIGGWSVTGMAGNVLGQGVYYAGGATLVLAFTALPLARRRFATPYFVFLFGSSLILSSERSTPLHDLLYLILPRFEELHNHWPERVMMIGILAPAMLAGAAVSALPRLWRSNASLVLIGFLSVAVLLLLTAVWMIAPGPTVFAIALGCLGVATVAVVPRPAVRWLIPVALLMVVASDQAVAGYRLFADGPYGGYHKVDLGEYYDSAGAVAFLQSQVGGEPYRYFGYDPALAYEEYEEYEEYEQTVLYRYQFSDPQANALIVNNRATLFGLQDVQGYNPVQMERYVEYITALNGHVQDYHDANIYEAGLSSPLLNLLNVRYVVVPRYVGPYRSDIQELIRAHPTVYENAEVRVLEIQDALPRAWIVHDALEVTPGAALMLLASDLVDPSRIALLEDQPPPLDEPLDPAASTVAVTRYEPDRITLEAHTDANGLLVLSEVYYPAWKAYVNGEAVDLYVANHALRAVPLPAGEHIVELRYESSSLQVGLAISLIAYACAGGAGIAAGGRWLWTAALRPGR